MATERAIVKVVEETKPEDRDWTDLPSEMLGLILSRLFLEDINCFQNVCRTWQSIPSPSVPCPTECPMIHSQWLLYIRGNDRICNFFHPVYKGIYTMETPELSGARIRFAKYGWLILSRGDRSVFFFNPFTKVRLELPPLPKLQYNSEGISFSSQPTSSDCLVFGISGYFDEVFIYIIRWGEETWTFYRLDNNLTFHPSNCNPVFYNGLIYCLGRDGNLGVFDPKEDSWTILANPQPHCDSMDQNCLVESDGELLAVFVGKFGTWISVFRLDRSKMNWKKIESLGDRMLFVSHTTSLSATAVVRGMENKIYFPRFHGKEAVYYSLTTSRYHSFGSDEYSSKDFYNTREYVDCTWIEPPNNVEKLADEDLTWLANPVVMLKED